MPDGRTGRLRIDSQGDLPVHEVAEFLFVLRRAYEGAFAFEAIMDDYLLLGRGAREYERGFESQLYYWSRGGNPVWPLEQIASGTFGDELGGLLRDQDRLVVSRVQLSSPGFWEFFGALNPLEFVRNFINDRHARRQDREYRERHESRRLELENFELENRVVGERLRMAREFGMPETTAVAFVNHVLSNPLRALETLDNSGLIASASMVDDVTR